MNIPGIAASASQARMGHVDSEAMETAAQTKTETDKGDPQAVLKLAALSAISAASGAANLPKSTGQALNKVA